MAYNPYSAVNAIYKLKGQWDNANNAGDTATKNNVATKAQAYYNQLRNNGYGDIADELTASNYTQAKAINDKWAKMGKTPTRDYLYTLGQSKGMSQSDVDKLISWDNLTGEVSFGGKKIGTPDSVVDGVSYWSDTSVLDNAFNDYIDRSGTVRSKPTVVNQENEKLFAKYNQEYEDLKTTNPFETDTAKAILAKYDLAGLQGRDNQVASGAGSNGGNIDSFAAANALRQQSALVNQGQQVVLDSYNQKLEHARALLSDMGVNIDRVFNQDETAKNNDVARKSEIASVSGYTPDEWVASNNPYLNDDGTLKEEYKDIDFAAVMANAKAAGNAAAYNAAAQARYYKIMGNYGAYGQYDDGNYIVPGLKQTEAARQFDEQIAASDRALNAETSMNAANNQTQITLADKEAASAINQIKTAAAYSTTNSKGTVTKDSSATYQNGVKVGDKNGKPILTKDQAVKMRDSGNTSDQVIYALDYYGESVTHNNDGDLLNGGNNSKNTAEADLKKLKSYFSENKIKNFIDEVLKPYIDNSWEINEEVLEKLIVGSTDGTVVENSNSKLYNIDVEDARKLCNALGLDASWVDKFTNRTWFNAGKGMKSNN